MLLVTKVDESENPMVRRERFAAMGMISHWEL
jgi:hypothetical protein